MHIHNVLYAGSYIPNDISDGKQFVSGVSCLW